MPELHKLIADILKTAADLKAQAANDSDFTAAAAAAAAVLVRVVRDGGCIYACGNGGSAADAIHFCEELTARYKRERQGIRAMHFMDPGFLTCWANDYDYASTFQRAVQTFCTAADVLVLFSTSGNSENILQAARAARGQGCHTIALTGRGGGRLGKEVDTLVPVPAEATERVQEVHICLVHSFLEAIEQTLVKELGVR